MRNAGLYVLLSLPILAWAVVVLPGWFLNDSTFSSQITYALVVASPVISGDLSVVGDFTPAAMAAAIIALLPGEKDKIHYATFVLAVISYVLFIHLGIFFSSEPGESLLRQNFADISNSEKVILKLVSNVRIAAFVVAATILGFKVKGQT
jgi:hypothetical protein